MLAYLEERVSLKRLIWLFPVIFILHDSEEIFTIPAWMAANKEHLRAIIGGDAFFAAALESVDLSMLQFTGAVLFELLIILLICALANRSLPAGKPGLAFTSAVFVLFANAFSHLGQTVILGGYAPGVVTAGLLLLPYGLYVYHRLIKAGLLSWRGFGLSAVVGVAAALPLVFTGHWIGRTLFPGS